MRVLGAVVVAAGAVLITGTAAVGSVPLPPVPTVTVSVPATPVPLPVIPKLPTPVLPEPVKPAASSAPSASAPQLGALPVGSSAAAPIGGGPSYGSSPSSSSSSASTGDSSRVDHFSSSRHWIGTSGSKRRRTTTFTFVLQQAGRVVFTVNQVSPACVGVGRFSASGRAGVNHVRFAGVVHGRRLTPGTYRISIRTASGHVVRRVTLVVVGGSAPAQDELHTLRAANVCHGGGAAPTTTSTSTTASTALASGGPATPLGPQELPKPKPAAASLAPTRAPDLHSGVLGSTVERTARAIQPMLVALLALSILLLGAASLPREAVPGPRVHDTLARHRVELAGLGAAALVAVAIAFLLS